MSENNRGVSIFAPMTGKVVALSEVPDKAFSDKSMGDGVAIIPEDGLVYSPINGYVTMIAESKHAFGFQTDDGLDILVHVGLDSHEVTRETTVVHVKESSRVQAGDLIAEVNLSELNDKGINTITPVILCEGEEGKEVKPAVGHVLAGAGEIFSVVDLPKAEEEQEAATEKETEDTIVIAAKNDKVEESYFSNRRNIVKVGVVFVSVVAMLVAVFVSLTLFFTR